MYVVMFELWRLRWIFAERTKGSRGMTDMLVLKIFLESVQLSFTPLRARWRPHPLKEFL